MAKDFFKQPIKTILLGGMAVFLLALAPPENTAQGKYPYPTSPVIGDDITGQNHIGAVLAGLGVKSIIPLEPLSELPPNRVVLFNTGARPLSAEETYQKTLQVAQLIPPGQNLILYRMDSTLRGHWAWGIQAILDQTDADLVVIAPAMPEKGRVTINGYQYEYDSTGERVRKFVHTFEEYNRDIHGGSGDHHSVSGLRSNILSILWHQLDISIRRDTRTLHYIATDKHGVTLGVADDIFRTRDNEVIQSTVVEVNRLASYPKGNFVVLDAESQEDLDRWAEIITEASKSKKIIVVGSSGLIKAVIQHNYQDEHAPKAPLIEDWKDLIPYSFQRRSSLTVVGSITPMSDQQIKRAKGAFPDDVKVISLNVNHILEGNSEQVKAEVKHARSQIEGFLKRGKQVILRTTSPAQANLSVEGKNKIRQALALAIQDEQLLSQIVLLILVGGDTTETVARALGTKNILPMGEVDTLVPINHFEGGMLDSREEAKRVPVIIKSGNIGDKNHAILGNIIGAFIEGRNQYLNDNPVRIGVTIGDPASAGPEMVASLLLKHDPLGAGAIPIIIGHQSILETALQAVKNADPELAAASWEIHVITDVSKIGAIENDPNKRNVIYLYEPPDPEVPMQLDEIIPGSPNAASGHAVIAYLEASADLYEKGLIHGITNAPISKEATNLAQEEGLDPDWPRQGHTEYYEARFGVADGKKSYTMVMGGDRLKAFLLQHHVKTFEAFAHLEEEEVIEEYLEVIRVANQFFKTEYGIPKPLIAVPGPNPHSGTETYHTRAEEHIAEAVRRAQDEGISAVSGMPINVAVPKTIQGVYTTVILPEHETGHLAIAVAGILEKDVPYPGVIPSMTVGLGDPERFGEFNPPRSTVLHGSANDLARKGTVLADALHGAYLDTVRIAHNHLKRRKSQETRDQTSPSDRREVVQNL